MASLTLDFVCAMFFVVFAFVVMWDAGKGDDSPLAGHDEWWIFCSVVAVAYFMFGVYRILSHLRWQP